MSEVKISQLPGASTLTGTETVPVVQNGVTARTTVQDIANKANPYNFTPENAANKSTDVEADGSSDVKYPSVKAVKDYTDGLVTGIVSDQGDWDASTGNYPTTRTAPGVAGDPIEKGDLWYISVAGTLGGNPVSVGYSIRALVNTPGSTPTNWGVLNIGFGFIPENVSNKSTDGTFSAADDVKYPTTQAVKTYVDANAGSSTLQSVTNSSNRGLTNGLNFQGTNSGPSSTSGKNNINAFGTEAANGYTGVGSINALGNSAAQSSSGVNINALGDSAAESNSGSNVNAFGNSAGISNQGNHINAFGNSALSGGSSGNNVNAFGNNAGVANDKNNVNLFGSNATATGNNQTVFAKDAGNMAIIDFNSVSGFQTYTLPNSTGTLALTSQITTPTLQAVTTAGASSSNTITVTDTVANAKKIIAKSSESFAAAELNYGLSGEARGQLKLTLSSGTNNWQQLAPNSNANGQTIILPSSNGTLALQTELTLQTITNGSNKNLTNGNNYQGNNAGDSATGTQKILIGDSAGKNNNAGTNIVSLGQNSGAYTATGASVSFGSDGVSIGNGAGSYDVTTGTISTGINNVFIGKDAGKNATNTNNTNGEKVFIGNSAGSKNNGAKSIAIGELAGSTQKAAGDVSYGANNVYIGEKAGYVDNSGGSTQGNNNVYIGKSAGQNCSGNYQIGINGLTASNASYVVSFNGGAAAAGELAWRKDASTNITLSTGALTASRKYTFPDKDITVAGLKDTTQVKTLTLTAAQINAIFTTGIEILSSSEIGVGKIPIITGVATKMTGTGTLWSTNMNFKFYAPVWTKDLFSTTNNPFGRQFTTSAVQYSVDSTTAVADTNIIVQGLTGNPTGGSGYGMEIRISFVTL